MLASPKPANVSTNSANTTYSHMVEITRTQQRKIQGRAVETTNELMNKFLTKRNTDNGWKVTCPNVMDWHLREIKEHGFDDITYKIYYRFTCESQKKAEVVNGEFRSILQNVTKLIEKNKWGLGLVDGQPPNKFEIEFAPQTAAYADLNMPEDFEANFKHIFGRSAQIDIVKRSILAGINSEWQDRFHVALVGNPACGKTEILKTLKKIWDSEAIIEFDATCTTQAGALAEIRDRDILPRIMIVEEIEKVNEDHLRWMLSLMDQRAEVRKTVNRSNIHRETKILTLATVNNYVLFKKIMSGALSSRFAHHVYCPNLSRQELRLILEREIARMKDGDLKWIEPTLDFAKDTHCYDPRRLIAFMKCGREKILTEKWQEEILNTDCANYEKELINTGRA